MRMLQLWRAVATGICVQYYEKWIGSPELIVRSMSLLVMHAGATALESRSYRAMRAVLREVDRLSRADCAEHEFDCVTTGATALESRSYRDMHAVLREVGRLSRADHTESEL